MSDQHNRIALFASDLDGTLIPTGDADRTAATEQFYRCVTTAHELTCAYITGRHFELALRGVSHAGLPLPDYFVCDVGTTMYHRDGDQWLMDEGFTRSLLESWNGKEASVVAAPLETGVSELKPQEPERQSRCKYSFYFEHFADATRLRQEAAKYIADAGFDAEIVTSVDPRTGAGLLDVLPPGSGKAKPLLYLANRMSLERREIVYAGDSGNDLLAFATGVCSIIVGNADNDLRSRLRIMILNGELTQNRMYMAEGHDVEGVLEGCRHYGVFDTIRPES